MDDPSSSPHRNESPQQFNVMRTRRCEYQEGRNIRFSENFTQVLNE